MIIKRVAGVKRGTLPSMLVVPSISLPITESNPVMIIRLDDGWAPPVTYRCVTRGMGPWRSMNGYEEDCARKDAWMNHHDEAYLLYPSKWRRKKRQEMIEIAIGVVQLPIIVGRSELSSYLDIMVVIVFRALVIMMPNHPIQTCEDDPIGWIHLKNWTLPPLGQRMEAIPPSAVMRRSRGRFEVRTAFIPALFPQEFSICPLNPLKLPNY